MAGIAIAWGLPCLESIEICAQYSNGGGSMLEPQAQALQLHNLPVPCPSQRL